MTQNRAPTPPKIQGWCPGALRPMESGDGWVVRVRPLAGRLSPAQARGLAQIAQAHGNGLIDVSARANVQLRGISSMASHGAVVAALRALGLLDDNAEGEAQRNVILTPFWEHGDGAFDLAQALSAALTDPAAPRLPGKFGFAVDLGAAPVLRAVAADIGLEPAQGGVLVFAASAPFGAMVPAARAVQTALDLAQWFIDTGGIGPDGRGRMARHLASGAALPPAFCAHPIAPAAPFAPQLGLTGQGALVALEFGQMTAQVLTALADLGPLRITPWRMVLIEGAQALPDSAALITAPDDPRLRITACTGAPACPQAQGATRDLARRLAPHVPQGQMLHLSGCAKGCAHPALADLTLTATPQGFDLVRGGRAGDTPSHRHLSMPQILQALHAP